jgi:hypothetical protein
MQKLLFALLWIGLFAGQAQADIKFSTSATDANAGSTLNLLEGQSGTMYVFVSTANGSILRGVNINILSSNAPVLQATSHVIDNPSSRWSNVSAGTLGDLVTNANALDFFGTTGGIGTSGQSDFRLFSTVNFNATAIGTTNLSFTAGSNGVVYRGSAPGNNAWTSWVKGTGSVSVSAVPEPNAALGLGLFALSASALRRRRR